MNFYKWLSSPIFLAITFFFSNPVFACPMCTSLFERGKNSLKISGLAQGFSASIAAMLFVPAFFFLAAIWIFWKKNKQDQLSLHE